MVERLVRKTQDGTLAKETTEPEDLERLDQALGDDMATQVGDNYTYVLAPGQDPPAPQATPRPPQPTAPTVTGTASAADPSPPSPETGRKKAGWLPYAVGALGFALGGTGLALPHILPKKDTAAPGVNAPQPKPPPWKGDLQFTDPVGLALPPTPAERFRP